ncbi:hypothetical protein BJF78_14835 [Pseudonocardia sp. CNS-139]|nr:hypothetical protein BJF78_14835 [Pseudonocardia sp. CNS-139]
MSVCQYSAILRAPNPVPVSGVEKPKPGIDGTTTSNASAGSPPCAAGSVSGPTTLRQSQNVQGQPCDRMIGVGSCSHDRSTP